MTIRIAIVGYGTIAQAQHCPAIAADPAFRLVAVVHPRPVEGLEVPVFGSLGAMLAAMPGRVDAVSLCTPPGVRRAIAAEAIAAGLAVLLEKPPAATLGEIDALEAAARAAGTGLFAAWHSQHAPAVAPAAALLAGESITRLAIDWREDVGKWHPGQEWIWEPDGFGVFDTGINALSIASAILPERLIVEEAELSIPEGRQAPIAARLRFAGEGRTATFDWREVGGEVWCIAIETASGLRVTLLDGGARLVVNGAAQPVGPLAEYPALYARFADLAKTGTIAVDREPLRLIADAALVARRTAVAPHA